MDSARTSKCIGWFVRLFMVPRQTDNRPHTKMAFVQTVMQAISGGPHLPAIRLINTRSEEHTSELQSLMRISYAVFCLKKKNKSHTTKKQDNKHKHNKIDKTHN